MSGQQKTDVMDAQSYDLLQSILKAYRFPVLSRRIASTSLATKLNDWVKFVEDKYMVDFNSLRPFFPEIASGLSGTQSEMTVNQFDKLETVFNPIDKFARDMWEAKTEIDEQTKQSHIQQVIDHIEMLIKTNGKSAYNWMACKKWEEDKEWLRDKHPEKPVRVVVVGKVERFRRKKA